MIQRKKESELLCSIAALSNYEIAEVAADRYSAQKHVYSFDGYLHQLTKLKTVLEMGIPPDRALEAVDDCLDIQTIINFKL